ncbi:MAG: hypothetical protein L0Y72_11645 [Gemmataceae bacterium]|nr:hypothetical protein [Gemmataceae bacterium]
MPMITRDQVIEFLTKAVEEDLHADDLLQVHNELFPDNPVTEAEVYDDVTPATENILDYINGDLAVEDLLDLWNLIYPRHRHVWYDEQAEKFHYNEESSPLRAD